MPSHERIPLPASQFFGLLYAIVVDVSTFVLKLPINLVKYRQWPWQRRVIVTVMQSRVKIRKYMQSSQPTTGEAVNAFAKKTGRSVTTHPIECQNAPATALHQVPVSTAETGDYDAVPGRALLYLHGGGYLHALQALGHPYISVDLARAARCESIFFLEYTLAPGLRYPGQLIQAAAACSYLIESKKIAPNDIYLAGDSAGGHLILSLLAHCARPHPQAIDLRKTVNMSSPFAAAILISPLISFSSDQRSFQTERSRDVLGGQLFDRMTSSLNPDLSEVYAEPLLEASGSFWREDIPVKAVGVSVGGWEILRDQILKFSREALGATEKGDARRLAYGPQEVHVMTGYDRAVGLGALKGETCDQLLQWLKSLDSR